MYRPLEQMFMREANNNRLLKGRCNGKIATEVFVKILTKGLSSV